MLSTVANVKAELKAGTSAAGDDARLLGYIRSVSARVRTMSWGFEPIYDTKYFTPYAGNSGYWNGMLELLDEKGQQLLLAGGSDNPTITARNGQNLVWNTDVYPMPRAYTPIKVIRLSDANGQIYLTWYPQSVPPYFDTISIAGWWGYRSNYATQGWLSSLQTVLNNPLTVSGTSITVTSVNATDSLGRTPTFSAGNLIRVESEAMLVVATDTTANTLTVVRAQNGTTAAQHAAGTAITIWEPEEQITQEVTRQATLLYQRRGAFDQMTITGIGATQYPRDLISSLYDVLQEFNNQ